MDKILDFLATPLGQAIALGVGLAALTALFRLARVVLGLAEKKAKETPSKLDDELVDMAEDAVDAAEAPAKSFLRSLVTSAKKPTSGPGPQK